MRKSISGPFSYQHEYTYTWHPEDPEDEPRQESGFLVEGWEVSWDGEGNFNDWARRNQIDILLDLATEEELLDALDLEWEDDDSLFRLGRVPNWIYAAATLAKLLEEGGFKKEYSEGWLRDEQANYYQTDHDTREEIRISTHARVPTIRGRFMQSGWPEEADRFIDLLIRPRRTAEKRKKRGQELLEILASAMGLPVSRLVEKLA